MRITDLNTLVTASLSDILYIVDVSDTGDFISGSSKQITVSNFFSSSGVLAGGGGGGGGGGSGYLVLTSSVVSASVNIDSTVFISNGIQTAYNVSGSVTESADDLIVFINGVSQIPNVNYTLSSSILTFSGIPSSGSKIDVRRANSVLSVTFITSSMGVEYFAGNNSSSQFTLTNGQTVLHNYDVLVSLDGLIQKPTTDYSITGSILNFTVPPPNNTDVEVRYLSPQTFTFISGSGGGSGTTLTTGSTYPITSSWSNNALTASYLDPISQSLIPSTGSTYSLGSPTNKWKDLYVSTGSIYIGDSVLSTSGSTLYSDALPIVTFNTSSGQIQVTGITSSLSSSFANTSSIALNAISSSYALSSSYARTASNSITANSATSASYALTSSYSFVANAAVTATSANTANSANAATSASYALTASFASNAGSSLTTGSTYPITASWSVSSSYVVNAGNSTSSSFASTASYVENSVSSSYALTASFSLNGGGGGTTLTTGSTYPITSSWANNVITASYALVAGSGGTAGYLSSQLAKAWVNFNGTGTVAIRDSYNVSSITDNATGDFTINYGTALNNSNYAISGITDYNESGLHRVIVYRSGLSHQYNTLGVRIQIIGQVGSSDNTQDPTFASLMVLGN